MIVGKRGAKGVEDSALEGVAEWKSDSVVNDMTGSLVDSIKGRVCVDDNVFNTYVKRLVYPLFDRVFDVIKIIGAIIGVYAFIFLVKINLLSILMVGLLAWLFYTILKKVIKSYKLLKAMSGISNYTIYYFKVRDKCTKGDGLFTKYYFNFDNIVWGNCRVIEEMYEDYEKGDYCPCLLLENKAWVLDDSMIEAV